MAHLKRFEGIPMSKTMRGICKEEDYAFLRNLEDSQPQAEEDCRPMDEEKRERHEERIRRIQERAQREEERQRELEEKRKQKEEEWKRHVAEVAAEREAVMRERALRLRDFRNFQRKILEEEIKPDLDNGSESVDKVLVKM